MRTLWQHYARSVDFLTRRWPVRVSPSEWPATVTFRRGAALATARPWNDAHPDAALRLGRGSSGFLAGCCEVLCRLGVPSVLSPPLPPQRCGTWIRAGFATYLDLALLRLDLEHPLPAPSHDIGVSDDIAAAAAVDAAAFDDFWAFDRGGLEDALASSRSSEMLAVGSPMAGFAIVGYNRSLSYLHRVAVHPAHQGVGLGTALVTEAASRARRRGARVMFLNTQQDNDTSLRVYTALGFEVVPEGLTLLRRDCS